MRSLTTTFSLTLLLSLFLPATEVLAQSVTYKVTPRVIDREVEARDIFTETITIENYANHKVSIFPSVNAVAIDEGGDVTEFTPASMSDNTETITSWLSITRAVTELAPGETIELPLAVKVHSQVKPGEYHAFIGFGTGRNRDVAAKMVQEGRAPGVIVSLTVDEKKSEFLRLGKFIIDRFVADEENDAVTYTLHNPGEGPVVPSGEIIITNSRGDEVGAIPINPNSQELAAGQETQFTASVPANGLLGKYKAFLNVDYGTDQVASVYDTAFFYVIPWQKLLFFFIILLILVALGTYLLLRGRVDEDEHDAHYVPLHVNEGTSDDQDHDINLKK